MTRTEFTLAAIMALATAAGGSAAIASGKDGMQRGDHGARMEQRFTEMDADKDGKVTPAEMRAYRDARFSKADANGDGKLTVEELDAARQGERMERMQKMVLWLDTDGDGMLSAEEFDPRRGAMMSRMDADGDGALSMEEMGEARQRMQHRHGKHHGMHHGEGRMGAPATEKN